MKVMDIFSWLPAQEISLEQLEQIFLNYKTGLCDNTYTVLSETPSTANENILNCRRTLVEEGKKVAYILKDENIIAVIGYKE